MSARYIVVFGVIISSLLISENAAATHVCYLTLITLYNPTGCGISPQETQGSNQCKTASLPHLVHSHKNEIQQLLQHFVNTGVESAI